MATYFFDTITAAQALAVASGTDNIIFATGPASSAVVTYTAATATVPDLINVTFVG